MRLIDADAMKRVYQEVLCSHVACIDCSFFMDDKYCRFETMLSEAPTINAIPVVRCRECKYHYWEQEPCHGKSVHYCKLPHMRGVEVFKEFFCYYGEREEGADNEP